jgi:hypothetical protein
MTVHPDIEQRRSRAAEAPELGAAPNERLVRHGFWKYPLIAAALLIGIVAIALVAGSPNWPRDQIGSVTTKDPGGAILAFTQELDGTSSSWGNTGEVGDTPDQLFVLGPLHAFSPLLDSSVSAAVATYEQANPDQRQAWGSAYEAALGSITMEGSGGGDMGTVASPDDTKIGTLSGDFGPVPTLAQASLRLAQGGYLEMYLTSVHPGHSVHLATIWLYDEPQMLNTAVGQGLTDDQWGMVKERGFPVGPWYLILPAVIHVLLPGGATGIGFTLWNLVFALVFLLALPLLPGLRGLPRRLRLYRLMYRYPLSGEVIGAPESQPEAPAR